MPPASSAKAMNIVSSRPMWSDTQPKNGRVTPFRTRSMASAKVNAGSVSPSMLTGVSAMPKSLAIGASCAVAMRPPAPTRTNITYMIQNTGVLRTSIGANWRRACGIAAPALGTSLAIGATRKSDSKTTMIPWPRHKKRKTRLMPWLLNHRGDRQDGESRAGTKPGRREARRQSASVGEPLESIAYAGAVHRARSEPAERGGDVEDAQRVGIGIEGPCQPAQDPASEHDRPGPESIDEIAFDRHEPEIGRAHA